MLMRNGRVGCVPSLPVDRSLPQSAYIVAYSDLTSKSPDYVLSKAGLFSTKLSQTIVP